MLLLLLLVLVVAAAVAWLLAVVTTDMEIATTTKAQILKILLLNLLLQLVQFLKCKLLKIVGARDLAGWMLFLLPIKQHQEQQRILKKNSPTSQYLAVL